MNRRLSIAGLLATVVVLAAVYSVAAAGNVQRPFKARSFEMVTSESFLPGSSCPVFEVNSEGNGTGTHTGDFTVVRRHCFTPPDHPAFNGEVIHDGTWESTTANGDRLWGTCSGSLQPTEIGDQGLNGGTITSPSTIDGGTGRLAGVKGEFQAVGDYDLLVEQGDLTNAANYLRLADFLGDRLAGGRTLSGWLWRMRI